MAFKAKDFRTLINQIEVKSEFSYLMKSSSINPKKDYEL